MESGVIDQEQLGAALGEQLKWGSPLGMTIVRMGLLDEETLVRTLARQLKLPLAWLRGKRICAEVLAMLPGELAQKHRCLPLSMHEEGAGRTLFLAMQDPVDQQAIDEIRLRIGCTIKPVLAAPAELEDALRRHYPLAAAERRECAAPPAQQDIGEPELLWFDSEIERSAEVADSAFGFGGDLSSRGEARLLDAFAALADALTEKGMLSRESLLRRLRRSDCS